jgi:hypothetical protein
MPAARVIIYLHSGARTGLGALGNVQQSRSHRNGLFWSLSEHACIPSPHVRSLGSRIFVAVPLFIVWAIFYQPSIERTLLLFLIAFRSRFASTV